MIGGSTSFSQSFDKVPSELIENANAVILFDNTQLEIESEKDFNLSRKYTTKILNRYSKNERRIFIFHDQFSKVKGAKVELFDVNFQRIEKYSLSDFNDVSIATGVASDSRAMILEVRYNQYPYYVQVSYEVGHSGSLHFPTWEPQRSENLAVVQSEFSVINHTPNPVRYYSEKVTSFDSTKSDNIVKYKWEVNNLKPYEEEGFSINFNYSPIVYTGPSRFEIDGFVGDMTSWKNFGNWINTLNANKNNLSLEQKAEIAAIVKPLNSDLEKIKAIYSYLQSTTRYVSIQLGIGGWSPFDAASVHENKYGDCKALSFYTKTALDEAGIDSYYTLIRAGVGAKDIFHDFPNAHFNHAILTVPLDQDTVWLECTSQTNPFGYMGSFTGNRKALMITDDGGVVINTKKYTEDENIQYTNANVNIKSDGSGLATLSRRYQGLEVENDNFIRQLNKTQTEREKWFIDELDFGTFTLNKFELKDVTQNSVPETGFEIEIELNKIATSNSDRLFIRPSLFTNMNYLKLSKKDRIAPIEVRYAYQQIDSIQFNVEDGFFIESNPEDEKIKSLFGEYSKSIVPNESGFLFIRKFILRQGEYSPDSYSDFMEYIKSVQKSDKKKIVYSKKT